MAFPSAWKMSSTSGLLTPTWASSVGSALVWLEDEPSKVFYESEVVRELRALGAKRHAWLNVLESGYNNVTGLHGTHRVAIFPQVEALEAKAS